MWLQPVCGMTAANIDSVAALNAQLMLAVHPGDLEATRHLLSAGADANAGDVLGYTAMHWDARRGSRAIARLLIGKGARVDVPARRLGHAPPGPPPGTAATGQRPITVR
jgi:ankyrin repeat protein